MKPSKEKKQVLNKQKDTAARLFCRFVVVVALVLMLINGIKFLKFFFYLIEKEIMQQATPTNF